MPTVSIILPTYNRAKFLPEAFAAIAGQQWTDWELIVVDDGSTDNTRELVPQLTRGWPQPVRYVYQENQGAYGARNTGLDHAGGKYVAFYDSDDLWLPHHVQDCVQALEANPDVDWVYGSCRMVNLTTGQEISPSTFYVDGQPRPFMKLTAKRVSLLSVIEPSEAALGQVRHGLFCGLQNSVIRRLVFEKLQIPAFHVGEDQLLTVLAALRGHAIGFLDNVHVVYRVHDENLSSTGSGGCEKAARNLRTLISGYEWLAQQPELPPSVRKAIRKRLGREYFWHLGYSTLWQAGRREDALQMFHRGLGYWPWDWRCWKTLVTARIRTACLQAK